MMLKRALGRDDCDNDGTDEAASILSSSVVSSSSGIAELEGGLRKEDDDDVDDGDVQSDCSAVLESSASDDTSLPTDGSTDTADPPCSTGKCHLLLKSISKT